MVDYWRWWVGEEGRYIYRERERERKREREKERKRERERCLLIPSIDLNNPSTFRDLSKPIGALNQERLAFFKVYM